MATNQITFDPGQSKRLSKLFDMAGGQLPDAETMLETMSSWKTKYDTWMAKMAGKNDIEAANLALSCAVQRGDNPLVADAERRSAKSKDLVLSGAAEDNPLLADAQQRQKAFIDT